MDRSRKKTRRILFGILLAVLIACVLYLCDGYRADRDAIVAFSAGSAVTKRVLSDNTLVFVPHGEQTPTAALVFYAGGKVDHAAYEPLMRSCAERGILCIVPKMPLQLAVLDMDAAERYQERFPEIDRWYIGGHSLGGAMAASFCAETDAAFEGLILLGAYSSADLSQREIRVLSIYGSEDGVMNREKYEKYRSHLPTDTEETVLAGGCHAYFGTYGEQKGDGIPTLTNAEQIGITAEHIAAWIGEQ